MWKNKVPNIGSGITKGFLTSGGSFELYMNVIQTCIMFMYSRNITEKMFKQFRKHILWEFIHEYTYIITVQTCQGQDIRVKTKLLRICSWWDTMNYAHSLILQDNEIMDMNIVSFAPYMYTVIQIRINKCIIQCQ